MIPFMDKINNDALSEHTFGFSDTISFLPLFELPG